MNEILTKILKTKNAKIQNNSFFRVVSFWPTLLTVIHILPPGSYFLEQMCLLVFSMFGLELWTYGSFEHAFSSSSCASVQSSNERINDWWIQKYVQLSGRSLAGSSYPGIYVGDWGKPRKT
jgi:hypothetical protein